MASMPRGVGSLVAFLVVPYLVRALTPRPVLVIGLCLSMLALWQIAHFDLEMDVFPLLTAGAIQGLGVGLLFAPLNTFAYATLDPAHRTEATIVATMVRSLGSSVGISALQASLVKGSALAHARLAERIVLGDPIAAAGLPPGMDPATQSGLAALNGEVTRQATMVSYDSVFAWMALAVACLFPLLLLMRPPPPGQSLSPIEAHVD
jgi:DHA2 family multidrug resistance protein